MKKEKLNDCLKAFYAAVTQKDGNDFKVSSLRTIRAAIGRYLKQLTTNKQAVVHCRRPCIWNCKQGPQWLWSEHVSSISSKASRSLGLIKRNLWNCPRKVRETAYTSIVRPKLEHASSSWDPHHKKEFKEKLLVFAFRTSIKQQVWQTCYLNWNGTH